MNLLRALVLKFLCLSVALMPFSTAYAHPPQAFINSEDVLVVDGQKYARSFFTAGYDLGDAMAENAEAYEFYQRHVTYRRWFAGLNWGAVGAAFVYAGLVSDEEFDGGTYLTIVLVPLVSGMFAQLASQRNLIRAINVYNGVPREQAQVPGRLERGSGPEVALLGWAWEF